MPRLIFVCLAVLGLAACTNPNDLDQPPVPLGDFHLGHNIVVAPNLAKGPVSREATKEEWIEVVKTAIDERFSRYEGTRLYHLGISIDGYVLAQPGIPVVASPKSILILQVTVWDDAKAKKLNEKPKQFTVIEALTPETVVGSGYTLTREEQMQTLSRTAAKRIQIWLQKQKREQDWFKGNDGVEVKAPAAPAPEPEKETDAAPEEDGAEEVSEDVTEAEEAIEEDPDVTDAD